MIASTLAQNGRFALFDAYTFTAERLLEKAPVRASKHVAFIDREGFIQSEKMPLYCHGLG